MASGRTQESFRKALADNLPQGEAYKAKGIVDAVLYKLLFGLAKCYLSLDQRADDLINEMFPQTVTESLEEWESEYGLPEECNADVALTAEERQKALLAKFASLGGQTPSYYVKLALDLGFNIVVTEFNGARYGIDDYGDTSGTKYASTTAPHVWYIDVLGIETIYAKYTNDRYTSTQYSKLGIDTSILECLINELKPAHSEVFFFYP